MRMVMMISKLMLISGRIGMRALMLMRMNMEIGMRRILKLSFLNILKILPRLNKVVCLSAGMNADIEEDEDEYDD